MTVTLPLHNSRRGRPPIFPPISDLDSLADPRLGIDDPELARLVQAVFSRILGTTTGARPGVHLVMKMLAGAGRMTVWRPDGSVEEAPFPELPTGWPHPRSANRRLKRREEGPPDLCALWVDAESDDGPYALLPLRYVCEYFHPLIWPVAATAIRSWGAAETQRRMGRFIKQESTRPAKSGPRKGELLSDGTLYTLVEGTSTFLHAVSFFALSDYRSSSGEPAAGLERWLTLPPTLRVPRPGPHLKRVVRRDAPPLEVVRKELRALADEVDRRLSTAVGREACLRPYRGLVLLAVIACTAQRIGAVASLCVGSYDPKHLFPDGEVGPALLFLVEKNGGVIPRWKALPPEPAAWLEGYLAYTGLATAGPLAPLWISEWETPRAFGKPKLNGADPATLSAIVLPGSSAHQLRHLGSQVATDAGDDYLAANRGYRRRMQALAFGEILLDHTEIHCDPFFYNDLASEEGRERWSRQAILGVWDYLWGTSGAVQGPDVAAIRAAKSERDRQAAELAAAEGELLRLHEEQDGLLRRGVPQPRSDTAGNYERLAETLVALQLLQSQLTRASALKDQQRRDYDASEIALREVRSVTIPLPDGEQPADDDDLDALIDDDSATAVRARQRDRLNIREVAYVFGVSVETARRWSRGQNLPPRNPPWDANPDPSLPPEPILRLSARKQYLLVDRLDPARTHPHVREKIDLLLGFREDEVELP